MGEMTVTLSNLNYKMLARRSASPIRETSDGIYEKLWAARDGAVVGMDWYTALVMEGRCFTVDTATGTSEDDLHDTWANTEPDLYIYVPGGVTVIPTYLEIGFEDSGTAQITDVYALMSDTEDTDRSLGGTAEWPVNLRTDQPYASAVTVHSVASVTNPIAGKYLEFWRPYMGFAESAFAGNTSWGTDLFHGVHWSVAEATVPPIAVGPACIAIWASTKDGKGYITATWIELPSVNIK